MSAFDALAHSSAFGTNSTKEWQEDDTDGYLLESALHLDDATTLFGRFKRVANDELFQHGEPLHGKYWAPAVLDAYYGSNPSSTMLFFRAKLVMK